VRIGLRWTVRLLLAAIESIERVDALPHDCPRATVVGAPNLSVRARGQDIDPLGRRRDFTAIALEQPCE